MNFLSKITGCFAMPAAENPTVAMMDAAYAHHGINARYINCEVAPEKLGDAVRGARAMGWAGFNCSLPHKVAVIEHLDGLGESAAIMEAVNCAVLRDGKLIGENTDGKGFLKSLRELTDPRGKNIVVLGAGGASRAICVELALVGAKSLTVVNRGRDRGEELVRLICDQTPVQADFAPWEGSYALPADTDILVNATSIGLYPDLDARPDLDLTSLLPGMIVADIIPNPPRTKLLQEAQSRGCAVLDGLGMLVNQGVINIKYWTGVDADGSIMRKRLEEIFSA
ncbi:shikimate dehydrogenase [Pseudaminobacter sp. 19-2017]|uniref:Shikimate dehydrogenase (NADP(+)) n=1 Tax=Pseudaminobacter soli (ex Zhang et al. 2022) TaxID=2831468 RepID=A0A942E3G5_9HYPH|nr:shikimate dehydrogenase [Pseudaminobacter soli]MBS3650380.1 shikimate dehydrogenase [Pseudaminobacter soli]